MNLNIAKGKPNNKNLTKNRISFCNNLTNKYCYAKGLPKGFHLNGNTIGFQPLTQKLGLHTK